MGSHVRARFDDVSWQHEHTSERRRKLGRGSPRARRIVDIRPAWQRAIDGEIAGSVVVERNHLEWRLHPASGAALPLARDGQEWIVVCTEGYTSSLAAVSLRSLGIEATDIVGGIRGWRAAGFPVVDGPTPVEHVVARHHLVTG